MLSGSGEHHGDGEAGHGADGHAGDAQPALDAHGGAAPGPSHEVASSHALAPTAGHAAHPVQTAHPAATPGFSLGGLALFFLSIQVWTYLLAFGGLTGLLLRTVAHVGEPVAGLCALGVGLSSATVARKVMRRLLATGDSGTIQPQRLLGTAGQVLVPAAAGGTGKIRLLASGQTIDMLAKSHDGAELTEGADVVIVDIKDGIAEVTAELEPGASPAEVRDRARSEAAKQTSTAGPSR